MSEISQEQISTAYERIKPYIRKTPVLEVSGGPFGHDVPVHLKLECLQHAGSFKPRGAFNSLIGVSVPGAGVVAASGGNHGAAVAYAAHTLGVPAHIYVPEISSPAKVNLIKRLGAEVIVTGARYADALSASQAFRAESGALTIHAYDQVSTLEGQGTVGLELEGQASGLDTLLVAVGGGGLIGGVAAWYRGRTKIVAVEPETSCALHAALEAGHPATVHPEGVAADSLGAASVGDLMFPIAQSFVDHVALVPDEAITQAQVWCWQNLRLATEPGGAVALAALLSGAYAPEKGERVGVIMCGANVELAKLAKLVSH
ncbi:MAG: threonine/serine dehydratase [Hyphomicrobiales bacterium]